MYKSKNKISRISKKDKNMINQQEMLNFFNIKINKKLREYNSSSETTRMISFNQWLAGIIDSDGIFYLSKKNYLSCEVTSSLREVQSLNKIKSKFGGSIQWRHNTNKLRWRLNKKALVEMFLKSINGFIYLKQIKFHQVMTLYIPNEEIKVIDFRKSGAWLSGFFEWGGIIDINRITYQITVSIPHKNKNILEKIKQIYGGKIFQDEAGKIFRWEISEKKELIKIFEYFTLYPLKSSKNSDIISAKRFFRFRLLKYHLDEKKKPMLIHFITLFQKRKKI